MMGGALGLAVLASLAASRTDSLRASGTSELAALTGGYHAAFLVGRCSRPPPATSAAVFLRDVQMQAGAAEEELRAA